LYEAKHHRWLAVTHDNLGRDVGAEAELAKIEAANGDDAAYQHATICAQCGNTAKALEWLETACGCVGDGISRRCCRAARVFIEVSLTELQ
jgi:hypothetical protein